MPPGARSLDQIYASLANFYDPQVNSIQTQRAALPTQQQADEAALSAQQTDAYDNILNSARQRGMGFSGIPLGEQAKYNSTQYMPALANLKSTYQQKGLSLEDAISQINERRNTQAQSVFENERNFYEQQRQYNESLAASKAAGSSAAGSSYDPSVGGGYNISDILSGLQQNSGGSATASRRADGGYNYTDGSGRAISAAQYAAIKGLNFRDVLSAAAKSGDKGATAALGFVGNDFGYDPRKITSKALADLYNSLVWGTGRTASYKAPAPAQKAASYVPPTGASVLNLITKK